MIKYEGYYAILKCNFCRRRDSVLLFLEQSFKKWKCLRCGKINKEN